MDQLVVGVPESAAVTSGDHVTLIGDGSDDAPTATQLADALETINYEIVTSISARVPRVYTRTGQIVAVDDLTGPQNVSTSAQEYRGR